MRQTFKGWLLRYCCDLTGLKTTSPKKLCNAASGGVEHALEPVFLYALECGQAEKLLGSIEDEGMRATWAEMLSMSSRYAGRAEAFLRQKKDGLPVRFQKVLNAFDSVDAKARNDDYVVGLIGAKVCELLEAKGMSRYRLCKDLALNEGNVYAWLAGDATKVSRATARRAWNYLAQ